jgi:hypothetical protein
MIRKTEGSFMGERNKGGTRACQCGDASLDARFLASGYDIAATGKVAAMGEGMATADGPMDRAGPALGPVG